MKYKILTTGLGLAIVMMFTSELAAAEKIKREFEVAKDSIIEIFNLRGSVEIKGWKQNHLSIEGVLDEESTGLLIQEKDNRILVKVELPRQLSPKKGSKLVIYLPQSSALNARGVSTQWSISELGATIVHSVSGEISLSSSSGDVSLNVVSAPVTVKAVDGKLEVTSLSGKIDVADISGEVSLSTVEGELHFTQPIIELARLNSINGAIFVDGKLSKQGDLNVNSVDGDVFLKIGTSEDLNCQLNALHGGDIKNHLKIVGKESNNFAGKHFSLVVGEGEAVVEATTISGTIHLQD